MTRSTFGRYEIKAELGRARQVDYIVLDRRHDFTLDLPLVFQAGPVRVYEVAP
jgi:hypothetical protein